MSAPLILPESAIDRHLKSMEPILSVHVDGSEGARVVADWQVVPMVAGLVDGQCEYVARSRGRSRKVPVAPVICLGGGLWAWFSYREEWDYEHPAGRTRRFAFRSAGLAIFFGYRNNQYKSQMFRAEWSGRATRRNGTDDGLLESGVAHPHWHFDAVESAAQHDPAYQKDTFRDVLASEVEEIKARDFGPQTTRSEPTRDIVSLRRMGRIHFPSAATWWKEPPRNLHVHSPGSPKEIEVWVERTLHYVVRELARL